MGCVNTALTAVPWGKVFKAIKVGVEAFKIWRALDRAYTAVKDAEEAARLAEDAVRAEHAMAEMRAAENAGADTAEGVACTVHSFVPGTGVRLADGTSKPISKVKVGDTVLATDPQTGVTAPEQVQQVIVTTTDKDFTTLTLDTAPTRGPPSGRSGQQTLTTTWHHPFWDATHHRWVDAHDLRPGTELRRADGTTVVVRGVRSFHQHGTTYDLTVGTLHTYYVLAGDTPLLVHNCPTGGAADLPDFDPNGIPRHQPGAAASRSGEASAESEAAAEEGKERAEFKTGAVEEVASVSQQIGDHIGQGVQATDPVTAAAVTITVTIDAVKKGLARRARRAAEGE